MPENPLVSVIVPIYKVENYLRECVDSIISQSYKILEIILVDDGSPDKCPEICDEYAKIDSRIKVIHKPNGGLSDARNAGIEIAKGEYLSFVDSDDVIHSQMIEVLMKPILEDKGLKMSACQFLKFDTENKPNIFSKINSKSLILNYYDYFDVESWVTAWGKIYRKELFDNLKYPVGYLHEDVFVTPRMCYSSGKIAFSQDRLYFYLQREGSIMNKVSLKKISDNHDAQKDRIDFFIVINLRKYYYRYIAMFVAAYIDIKLNHQNYDNKEILRKWKKDCINYCKYVNTIQKLKIFIKIYCPRYKVLLKFLKKILPLL